MKLIKKKKGFTIVELVIVIGVIGVLAGILIPTFVNVQQKAEAAALKSDLANSYSAYVADAADGKIDEPTELGLAAGTYTLELKSQEEVVLEDASGNKYDFDGEAWGHVYTGSITDPDDSVATSVSTSAKVKVMYGRFYIWAK